MARVPEERLYFDSRELTSIEHEISRKRHVERYGMIRQWCYGVVVDCACGCGYGTYMISKNPEVNCVYGVDNSQDAINWAKNNFQESNVNFVTSDLKRFDLDEKLDVMVSIETIEHIKNLEEYIQFVKRLSPQLLILSYPSKRSTHYNKYHYHDLTDTEVEFMFELINYKVSRAFNLYNEVTLVHLRKNHG